MFAIDCSATGLIASNFSVAVRTISGAQVLDQCGAVVIAGLAVARGGRVLPAQG